jgi:hypothetical protein
METNEKSLKEKVDELMKEKNDKINEIYTEKKFRMPMKSKVSNGKVKKGFATVMTIKENNNIDFVRKQIIGNTIKLEDGEPISIHALQKEDLFFYKGKPFIFQPKGNLNAWNPLKQKDETYGQPLVMARMEGDKLSIKKGIGKGGWIVGAVILGIIAYAFITGA